MRVRIFLELKSASPLLTSCCLRHLTNLLDKLSELDFESSPDVFHKLFACMNKQLHKGPRTSFAELPGHSVLSTGLLLRSYRARDLRQAFVDPGRRRAGNRVKSSASTEGGQWTADLRKV